MSLLTKVAEGKVPSKDEEQQQRYESFIMNGGEEKFEKKVKAGTSAFILIKTVGLR